MAVPAACGFPDPELLPDEDLSAEAGSGADAATDATSLSEVLAAIDGNQNVDPSGKDKDAATRADGQEKIDAAGGCPNTCDCDDDLSKNGGCTSTSVDCDDYDPLVHPGQDFVQEIDTPAPPRLNGDWNCDGTVTKQYAVNIGCGGLGGDCNVQGFKGDPKCGELGAYVFCKKALFGLACDEDHTEQRRQGCK